MTSNVNGFDITLPAIILEKMTYRYDALRFISTYYTVTNGSAAFETQQVRVPHITFYYLRRHILTTLVTILHLITASLPIESESIREPMYSIAI